VARFPPWLREGDGRRHTLCSVKFWKFFLSLLGVVGGSIGTLLFQPTVFCEITVPVAAKLAGWKAQAVSARLSAFGTLEILELEAVNERKSRFALDSAKVEFDPIRLLTGRPEILRADFKFAMMDLELTAAPEQKKEVAPFSIPFSLREASLDLVEGRLRTETGAWILKSVHASAEGWDGRTPREIRVQLGRLDWNGPGQQELATTTKATAQKSKDPAGGDLWDLKLTTDVSTVVDLPPWNLVAPCQLVLEGKATQGGEGDWRMDGLHAVWQGVGGIRVAAKIGGTYAASGQWTAELDLEPTDLQLAGVFLQPRGIQNVYGSLAGRVNLQGGPKKPLGVEVEMNGQTVQLAAAGANWPSQPAALGISSRAEWAEAESLLKVESLTMNLGRAGQPADLQLSLDRPAVLQLTGKPKAEAAEPAMLQWAARGLELAAVVPILIDPAKLKVEGGKISGSGQARIEGEKVGLGGKVESRALTAAGSWVQGNLSMQSATADFQGFIEKGTKIHLESAQVKASWEGGTAEDLTLTAKAEWDWVKKEGFLAGDLSAGLAGLGKAWAGAKFWPAEGQAKAHVEFSGNFSQKGAGLVSLTLDGMRWPEEKAGSWGAKLTSELQAEQGTWTLPALELQANRAGEPLLDAKVLALWNPAQDMGRMRVELARAESAFVVPLLKNFTPDWQWTEASGSGSFDFSRKNRHDLLKADLQGAVTVETGTAQRPRPVDFASVQGNLQASWPSGTEGELAIEAVTLVAKHRDGTEAVRASLDAPLVLTKKGAKEWEPAGTKPSSGMVQFAGWPMGIVAPLILPKANETSIAGTLSGFLRVQSDPQKRSLAAQMDLSSPDLSVQLPELRLPENQVNLKADLTLKSDGDLAVQKVMLASRQGGVDWLELSAEKATQPGLAVVGKVDLSVAKQNVPAAAPYVSAGSLLLKANVGEPKGGLRKLGFSAEAQGLSFTLPEIGTLPGLRADAQGILSWGADGLAALDDLNLTAQSAGGELFIGKVDYRKNGAWAWESARLPKGWVATLAKPWLGQNRWVDGDLVLGPGFWELGEHGSSGEIDLLLLEARISEESQRMSLSFRCKGEWEHDNRTQGFTLKDAFLICSSFDSAEKKIIDLPAVQIPLCQTAPGLFDIKLEGGVVDLRGFLDQYESWKFPPTPSGAKSEPTRLEIDVKLDQAILPEARVGPVKISRFRYGPEGILLDPSSVEVQGGVIRGSVVPTGGAGRPLQVSLFIERFPLGAILGPLIQDARGPVGGLADLKFTGQAAGAKLEDLQRTLSGQGNLRLEQAHLENLPAIARALQGAGALLGSAFVAGSEINSLAGAFQIAGTRITTEDLRTSGSALATGMRGSLDWSSQAIDFLVNLALTREAIQSSGQLQGVMTQLVGTSSEFYTKIPGSATITGTLADPKVQMDIGKMLAEGGINLLLNAPSGVLQGAGGAAGGAAGAAGSILQGVGNLFKGF